MMNEAPEAEDPLIYSKSKVSWKLAHFIDRTPFSTYFLSLYVALALIGLAVISGIALKTSITVPVQGRLTSESAALLTLAPEKWAEVRPGMRVILTVEGLPESVSGSIDGVVESISELSPPKPRQLSIRLKQVLPEGDPQAFTLEKGMNVSGFLILRRTSLLKAWISK